MDHIVGNAAPGFVWKGHTTRLLDGVALCRFERHLFGRHFEALQEMRGAYGEAEYHQALNDLRGARTRGDFGLMGPVGRAWLATPEGVCFLLELILVTDGLSGWDIFRAHPRDANDLIGQVMRDSGIIIDEKPAPARGEAGGEGVRGPAPFPT